MSQVKMHFKFHQAANQWVLQEGPQCDRLVLPQGGLQATPKVIMPGPPEDLQGVTVGHQDIDEKTQLWPLPQHAVASPLRSVFGQ
jgi:hypothetical protein